MIELLDKFGIKNVNNIYIQETFYIDGEIVIGDYNEDKFKDIIDKVGEDNFIYLNRFGGSFEKETDKTKLKLGYVGKMNYSNDVIKKIKVYPVCINFFQKDRIDLVFYDIKNDEIIELSFDNNSNGIEFGFSSENDINSYIKTLNRLLKNKEIIQNIKNEIYKFRVS